MLIYYLLLSLSLSHRFSWIITLQSATPSQTPQTHSSTWSRRCSWAKSLVSLSACLNLFCSQLLQLFTIFTLRELLPHLLLSFFFFFCHLCPFVNPLIPLYPHLIMVQTTCLGAFWSVKELKFPDNHFNCELVKSLIGAIEAANFWFSGK